MRKDTRRPTGTAGEARNEGYILVPVVLLYDYQCLIIRDFLT